MDKIGFEAAKTAKKEKSETAVVENVVEKTNGDGASDLWRTPCMFAGACVVVGLAAFFIGTSVGRQTLIDEINASNLSITFSTRHHGDSIRSWVEVNPSVN